MLDYNLEVLAGPRCQELKVDNPANYDFHPRDLLQDIFQVFLNLSVSSEFVTAVARDGREL